MLQAATAWFNSSQILQNYALSSAAANGFSSSTSTSGTAPIIPFTVGPWKVQEASHKTTQKKASIWTCDKRSAEMDRLNGGAKETVVEVLKSEVLLFSRC